MLEYAVRPGLFQQLCNKARTAGNDTFVLIIDEMNRADVAAVFGEMLLLLEYRGDRSVILPYSQRRFTIPRNVIVLGTMNTADRSLALVDFALRRRFNAFPLGPSQDVLAGWAKAHADVDADLLLALFGLDSGSRRQQTTRWRPVTPTGWSTTPTPPRSNGSGPTRSALTWPSTGLSVPRSSPRSTVTSRRSSPSRADMLELREYETRCVELSPVEAGELAALTRGSSAERTQPRVIQQILPTGQAGWYDVQPGPYVGRFTTGSGLTVDVASRFDFGDLLEVLRVAARQPAVLTQAPTPARGGRGLLELIATAYVRELHRIAGFGLAKGYVTRTFTHPPYPGVPDATAHLARHLGRPDRLVTRARRLTVDIACEPGSRCRAPRAPSPGLHRPHALGALALPDPCPDRRHHRSGRPASGPGRPAVTCPAGTRRRSDSPCWCSPASPPCPAGPARPDQASCST